MLVAFFRIHRACELHFFFNWASREKKVQLNIFFVRFRLFRDVRRYGSHWWCLVRNVFYYLRMLFMSSAVSSFIHRCWPAKVDSNQMRARKRYSGLNRVMNYSCSTQSRILAAKKHNTESNHRGWEIAEVTNKEERFCGLIKLYGRALSFLDLSAVNVLWFGRVWKFWLVAIIKVKQTIWREDAWPCFVCGLLYICW